MFEITVAVIAKVINARSNSKRISRTSINSSSTLALRFLVTEGWGKEACNATELWV